MQFFFWIVSLGFYLCSPKMFSFAFCASLFVLSVMQLYFLIRRPLNNRKYFNYYTLFSLINIFVIYSYPLIIFGYDPNLLSSLYIDPQYINRGTALGCVLLSSFMAGVGFRVGKVSKKGIMYNKKDYKVNCSIKFKKSVDVVLNIIAFVLVLKLYSQFGKVYAEIEKDDVMYSLFITVFAAVLILRNYGRKEDSFRNFCRYNKWYIIPLVILILCYLLVGVRYTGIALLLLMFCVYIQGANKIKWKYFIIVGIASMIFLSSLAFLRANEEVQGLEAGTPIAAKAVYTMRDITFSSSNIYRGYMYVDKYGFLYGQSYVPMLFSPIPLLPSIMSDFIYRKTVGQLSTQVVLSNFAGQFDQLYDSLLGTNCFIDAYMNLGLFFSILFFFLFGLIVNYLEKYKNTSVYLFVCYCFIFSSVVFVSRGTVIDSLREIIWCCLIIAIGISSYKKEHKVQVNI